MRSEHQNNLPQVIMDTLVPLSTCYLFECNVPPQWKTNKTVLLFKKSELYDIGNNRPICLLFIANNLFPRVILNQIYKTLDREQPFDKQDFENESRRWISSTR
ncbi:unnamed protein product [Angiostrongylus costaricensis]|uniref:Uncharacterized protein n=1 Tax=Angiostrongylus costaricensis TaxID=334426 RepID=A0A0R3PMR9_ANGCS|nr:unnamed protein product [Angiostrongylus costaricensis]